VNERCAALSVPRLRREEMRERLILRHRITRAMRNYWTSGFIDIETPMLSKATPEAPRLLVPSRTIRASSSPAPVAADLQAAADDLGFDRYYNRALFPRRDCAPTGSRNSPSSTSRRRSSISETSSPDGGLVRHLFKQVLNVDLPDRCRA